MMNKPYEAGKALPVDSIMGSEVSRISNSSATEQPAGRSPYLVLTKPMLNLLVMITTAAGFLLATNGRLDWLLLGWTLLGTMHAAFGASALNQRLEWRADAKMQRTRQRPIPAKRIKPFTGLFIGAGLVAGGMIILATNVNLLTALLAAGVVALYLGVYTPLKRHSTLCTLIGAVCGAIPALMGFSAATGRLDYPAWTLAALLFVWQIPHFLALAWRYREDYARSGFVMLSMVDAEGRLNASMLLLYALALIPLALAPALAGLGGLLYIITSLCLGSVLVWLAVRQYSERTVSSARHVFLASVIYLPLLLGVLAADHVSAAQFTALAKPEHRTDGQLVSPDTGFDLSTTNIPREQIYQAAGKDSIPALTNPEFIDGSAVEAANHSGGHGSGKFLVGGDRVIGVVVNGEARAYPLRILNWHEIANDTLGGMPIAVTYCPLCDSAVVFNRRVDSGVLEFGVSGMLYNSNLLMYDRQAGGEESLWSQLLLRAVSGPAAAQGMKLAVLPAEIAHWEDWFSRYPQTTVITGDSRISKRYQRNPYGHYEITGELMFPVEPQPGQTSLPLMSRVLAVRNGDTWQAFAYDDGALTEAAAAQGWEQSELGLEFAWSPRAKGMTPPTLRVSSDDALETVYTFWFAWHAMYPDLPAPELVPVR